MQIHLPYQTATHLTGQYIHFTCDQMVNLHWARVRLIQNIPSHVPVSVPKNPTRTSIMRDPIRIVAARRSTLLWKPIVIVYADPLINGRIIQPIIYHHSPLERHRLN